MLESLGYARGARARRGRPDPVQHLLDPRGGRQPLHRPPRRGQAAQVRGPRARGRRRRLLGAVGQGRGLRALPVRRRRLRPRPDRAGWPSSWPPTRSSAQGYFEFEDFSGHLPMKREREFQAWLQISQGCNCRCSYCIVPSTRGREQSRDPAELVAEVERLAADGVREVTLLGQNVNSYGRDLPARARTTFAELLRAIDAVDGIERIRYTSPHPKDMREDVIRAHAELRGGLRAHPPAAAVGLEPDPEGDAPHLQPRALPRPRGADPRARARLRADHRHHRRLPGRDRGRTSRQTLEVVDAGRLRRRLHLRLLAAARHRGRRRWTTRSPHAVKRERMERLVEAGPAPRPRARRSASSAARWRCSSRARAAPTRAACAAAPATTRRSTSRARRSPASWSRSRSTAATSQTLDRARAAAQPRRLAARRCGSWRSSARPRSARPASRSRSPSCCASAARTRSRSPATRSRSTAASRSSAAPRAPTSARGSSTGCSASRESTRSSRPGASPSSPTPRSTQLLADGPAADRRRRHRPLPARGARRARAAPAGARGGSRAEVEREIAERGPGGASRRAPARARLGRAPQRPQADRRA